MSKGRTKISPEFLQKLKSAINIIDVIGEHVVLKKSGSNYSGLCPFHSERTPSFSVSEQKQLYHCYGCKESGDLFTFVQEIQGISFIEAVEDLAARAKIALPKEWNYGAGSSDDPEVAKQKSAFAEKLATAFKLNRFVASFYHQQLSLQNHIAQYFKNRGLTDDLVRSFYLGAAPPLWDSLATHLESKKAPLTLAVDLGLIKPSPKPRPGGPGHYDFFRNRALFPIIDLRGKVVGFGGRALPLPEGAPDIGGESPKYLNPVDSFVYQKSKVLYGLYQAQKFIREKDEVIVVEGYFDVLGMHAGGFNNTVAACGTALTPEHLQIIKRLCNKIVLLFDSDRAGIEATERTMELGLDHGIIIYGAKMPQGLDPDELILKPGGKDQMQVLLAAAEPILDSKIEEQISEALKGPEAQSQALKKIGTWLGRYKDSVGREVRINQIQSRLGIDRNLLHQAMSQAVGSKFNAPVNSAPRPMAKPKPNNRPQPKINPGQLSSREKAILCGLTYGGAYSLLFAKGMDQLPKNSTLANALDYVPAKEFVQRALLETGFLERFRDAPSAYLGEEIDPQVRTALTEALLDKERSFSEQEVQVAINRSIARILAQFSQRLRTAIADAEAKKDAELQQELMQEYLDVQRRMKEFNNFYE